MAFLGQLLGTSRGWSINTRCSDSNLLDFVEQHRRYARRTTDGTLRRFSPLNGGITRKSRREREFGAASLEVAMCERHPGLNVVALNVYYLVDGAAPIRIPADVNDETDGFRN